MSNLVFELWELKPPTLSPKNNMGTGSSSSSSSKPPAVASSSSSPGVFAVRVLYNKQPLQLPGASEGERLPAWGLSWERRLWVEF